MNGVMNPGMSFDHRVVDGGEVGPSMQSLNRHLESFGPDTALCHMPPHTASGCCSECADAAWVCRRTTSIAEKRAKPGLRKMLIGGQRLVDVALLHDDERDAVCQPPFLVQARGIEIDRLREEARM